jgi:hypothetical protein
MLKKKITLLSVVMLLASLLSSCKSSLPTNDEEAMKLLSDLNTKGRLLTNQPGWVHVNETITYDIDAPDRGTLMNGATVPLEQKIDIWYHINDGKRVYEYVWIMSDKHGETVDVGVYMNDNLYDLMNNTSSPLNPYYLKLDYQFETEMESFIERGGHPVVTSEVLNGKTATVFTLNESLSEPKTSTDYTQPFVAASSTAYFDAETGLLLRVERSVTFQDGTRRIFFIDDLVIEADVQPTEEVLNYVNGFW